MDDLVTWLRGQVDEDERRISGHSEDEDQFLEGDLVAEHETGYPSFPILLISKKRMVREVEAKRRILDGWEDPAEVEHFPEGVQDGRDPDERDQQVALASQLDWIVRLLALPYADRPGYREEWRP